MQSKTAIRGIYLRRLKARLGAPTAINARGSTKLARLFYRMLKFGATYVTTVKSTTNKSTKTASFVISVG